MRFSKTLTLLVLASLGTFGCKKEEQPALPAGGTSSYYIRFDLDGKQYSVEQANPDEGAVFDPGYGSVSIFRSDSLEHDIQFGLMTDRATVDGDFLRALKGQRLPVANTSYPWVSLYMVHKGNGRNYCTGNPRKNYEPSSVIIEEVTQDLVRRGLRAEPTPSYTIRGRFECNVSDPAWTSGVPDTMHRVTGGAFAIRFKLPR